MKITYTYQLTKIDCFHEKFTGCSNYSSEFMVYYCNYRNIINILLGVIHLKTSNWKFFVGIGLLLIIAGFIILPDDGIIGIIGILFGVYNAIKGIRLQRGIQPLLIRKQQEQKQKEKDELKDKMNHPNDQENNEG